MNPYQQLAANYARLAREARSFPLGGFSPVPRKQPAIDAPKVVICSPHPDDEVIIGGLALRLMRESGWRVVNVAVTQGSNRARQAERLSELRGCCEWIGFELRQTAPNGLERIHPQAREQDPEHWSSAVQIMAAILARERPQALFFPHAADWNSSHIGTHYLVMDALKTLPPDFHCYTVETEFWGAMASPNLMVEISEADLGDLMTALTFHAGEVRRNPYHLTLPAWMADNVRRGGELVGGQGGAAPDFAYATLYRLGRWTGGKLKAAHEGGRVLGASDNPASVCP